MKSSRPSRSDISKVDPTKGYRDESGRFYWRLASSHAMVERFLEAGNEEVIFGVKLDEPEDPTDTVDDAVYFAEVGDEISLSPYLDPERIVARATIASYPGRPQRGARSAYVALATSNELDYIAKGAVERKTSPMEDEEDESMDLGDANEKSLSKSRSAKKTRTSTRTSSSQASSRIPAESSSGSPLKTFHVVGHDTMGIGAEGATIRARNKDDAQKLFDGVLVERELKPFAEHRYMLREINAEGVYWH